MYIAVVSHRRIRRFSRMTDYWPVSDSNIWNFLVRIQRSGNIEVSSVNMEIAGSVRLSSDSSCQRMMPCNAHVCYANVPEMSWSMSSYPSIMTFQSFITSWLYENSAILLAVYSPCFNPRRVNLVCFLQSRSFRYIKGANHRELILLCSFQLQSSDSCRRFSLMSGTIILFDWRI